MRMCAKLDVNFARPNRADGRGLAVWMWFGFAVSWRNVVLAEIGLAVLAFAILDSARILFRRDRFFERSQRP